MKLARGNNARWIFIVLFILPLLILSQETQTFPKHYICTKTTSQISIDGVSNEKAWQSAEWSDDFMDIEGGKMPAPKYRTRVKMLWDEETLFILAELEEPHIRAAVTERDQIIYLDNDFEIFLDPDGDNHNYYEIEVNALGIVFDLFMGKPYKSGGRPLIGWDLPGLETAIGLQGTINNAKDTDDSWTVEMAMPLEAFRMFAPGKKLPSSGDIWRISFSRVQWKEEIVDGNYKKQINPETGKPFPEMNWVWSPQGVVDMHRPETWGYLIFADRPKPQAMAQEEIDPYFYQKMLLVDFYNQQQEFFKMYGKYAGSLFELNKRGRTSNSTIFIEATSKQFLVSLETSDGKRLFIDHEKRIWLAE
jgi:hypothetical protein